MDYTRKAWEPSVQSDPDAAVQPPAIEQRSWGGTGSKAPGGAIEAPAANREAWGGSGSKAPNNPVEAPAVNRESWNGTGSKAAGGAIEAPAANRESWSGTGSKEPSAIKAPAANRESWSGESGDLPALEAPKMLNENWGDMGVKPPVMVQEFRGINSLSEYLLDLRYTPIARNVDSSGFPFLKSRPGIKSVFVDSSGYDVNGWGKGPFGKWKKQVHWIAGGDWKYKDDNGVANSISTYNLPGYSDWWGDEKLGAFCNFQGNYDDVNLLFVVGNGILYRWDGTQVTAVQDKLPAGLNFLVTHDNRLYGAAKDRLYYSALRKAEDWTTADEAGEIVVETSDGKPIVGLMAGTSHVLVFKENSIFELWGNGPSSYTLQQISGDVGAFNHNCICMFNGAPYWLGPAGLFTYNGSRPRDDFAQPVKHLLDKMNVIPGSSYYYSVGTDGKKLYVSLYINSNTGDQDMKITYPNAMLVYDPKYSYWSKYEMQSEIRSLSKFPEEPLMIGTGSGRVVKWDVKSGADPYNAPIFFTYDTPPFGATNRSQKAQIYKLWIVLEFAVSAPEYAYVNIMATMESYSDDDFYSDGITKADWRYLANYSKSNGIRGVQKIMIPLTEFPNAYNLRLRFDGFGPLTIREIGYQMRELPL